MSWKNPEFSEIKMDAEIGSYQEDFEPVREPAFVAVEPAAAQDRDA